VVDHFDLNREVVSIAMNHLDRYLGSYEGTVDKNLFQLLAMTCLYMSIKLNEYKHLIIPGSRSSMDTILQLSRGFFTLEEMEKMEFDVLNVLGWHVHPPTPQVFVKHFLFFLGIEQHEIHDLSQFMVELSIMDYFFVSYKPSEVALASLLNAVDRLCPHGMAERISLPFQTKFLDLNSPAVSACRARLSLIYAQANEPTAIPAAEGSITPSSSTKTVHPAAETRTISPVSVMATPHVVPSSSSSSSFSAAHYGIQTTYVHSSWCA
jgi:lipoyl(octanoyl) transferase